VTTGTALLSYSSLNMKRNERDFSKYIMGVNYGLLLIDGNIRRISKKYFRHVRMS
jgi:hypothetical protein